MKLPYIIGIYSDAPQSGKSTVAEFLVDEFGYKRLPFAQVLKQMCRPLFSALGYSTVDIFRFETGDKSDAILIDDVIVCSVRQVYQTLGTEWGRNCISPDLWVEAWKRSCDEITKSGVYGGVVADDLRFPNELAGLRSVGGKAWSIKRPGTIRPNGHSSEGQLDCENADFVISNDSTIESLIETLTKAWSIK